MTFLVLLEKLKEYPQDTVTAHRAFLAENRKSGKVGMSGPFQDGKGGAYTVIAETLEDADRLTDQDPLKHSGLVNMTIHPWALNP